MSLEKKNKSNRLIWTAIGVTMIIDLLAKEFVFAHQIDMQFITPVINHGGARSLTIGTPILIILTMVACIALIYLYAKKTIHTVAFILLFAGALGNFYDRLIFNGVRDRIHIGNFPVFNLADVMLTIGVILVAWQYKQQSRQKRNA